MPAENETTVIHMYIEGLNKKFDEVITSITELKVSINQSNANNDRQMDAIKNISKEVDELRITHQGKGCMPLQGAINVRDEQVKHVNIEIEKLVKSVDKIDKDIESMKIKIALWSGGISVGVWFVSFLLKGLWK